MKFFIDNNLSEHLARGMKAFGEDVEHLKDRFPAATSDPEWLQYLGTQGILLITRDERVRWRPVELESLLRHKVGAFFLGGKNRNRCELIQQLVRNWSQMKDWASKTPRPFAMRVPPQGTKFKRIPLS
ncbi:MAG TPA: DUF5615 family PIN-like protein [Thermoanaerobaculia bacterium]